MQVYEWFDPGIGVGIAFGGVRGARSNANGPGDFAGVDVDMGEEADPGVGRGGSEPTLSNSDILSCPAMIAPPTPASFLGVLAFFRGVLSGKGGIPTSNPALASRPSIFWV